MVEPIAQDVWGVPGEQRLPGCVTFPLRMTVVALPDGGLWLHSPVPIDEPTALALEALGPVRHIVAPSRMHTLHAAAAKARWPDAMLVGPKGLAFDGAGELTDVAPEHWGDAFELVSIRGAERVGETVFFHKASGSLLCTDLVFNFQGDNLPTRLMLRLIGCNDGLRVSKSWGWVFAKDRALVGESVRRMLSWPIERVIPCHGDVVDVEAFRVFEAGTAALAAWR